MSKGWKLFFVLGAVLFSFVAGSAMRELTSFKAAGVGTAIGGASLFALFGMFWIADNWKDAITAAVTVTYFIFLAGILGIYVFPNQSLQLEGGAKTVLDNFTGLVMVVISAYFGQEAVRAAAQAYVDGRVFGPGGRASQDDASGPAQVDTAATATARRAA